MTGMKMNNNFTLTPEQRRFAADNHEEVGKFLKGRRLSFDKYYDVVIFGYLRAVRSYFERPDLRNYSFVTIAKWSMSSNLYNHIRNQRSQKIGTDIVSLDAPLLTNSNYTLADKIGIPAPQPQGMEMDELWSEIASRISSEELSILRMRTEGFTYGEIAQKKHMAFQDIHSTILRIRDSVRDIFEPIGSNK